MTRRKYEGWCIEYVLEYTIERIYIHSKMRIITEQKVKRFVLKHLRRIHAKGSKKDDRWVEKYKTSQQHCKFIDINDGTRAGMVETKTRRSCNDQLENVQVCIMYIQFIMKKSRVVHIKLKKDCIRLCCAI